MHEPGNVLNARYRVEKILGQGGMGSVYLTTHLELEELVAVKEMKVQSRDAAAREASEKQFRAEARILNRLRHPGLPRVLDFFKENGHHYLVMDYIEGGSLEQSTPSSEATVLQWARELCDVLAYLHTHDPPVIFRDLKPANIMRARDGTIRLIDFGIAKMFDPTQGADTRTVVQGAASHGFAAPEQYAAGAGTDARSDIYAFGATLYALLTGQVPPASVTLAAGLNRLPPLQEVRPDLTPRTVVAVERMMQIYRDKRPIAIAEVRDALGFGPESPVEVNRVRSLLREEFHPFFPMRQWLERDSALQLAEEILATSLATERAPLMTVAGEPGLGKSRFLRELQTRQSDTMAVLPISHGSRGTMGQGFSTILPAMCAWMEAQGDSLTQTLQARLELQELYEAAALLPPLRAVVAGFQPAQRTAVERSRSVMSTLVAVIEAAATHRSVLLLLDDMQWTDDETMRLLDVLRNGPAAPRIAMVLAYHEVESERPGCADFLERWVQRGDIHLVSLPRLSLDEVGHYLTALLPPIQDLTRHLPVLHRASRGNPLLLEEIVRFMAVRRLFQEVDGALRIADFRPDILPTTVRDAARRRLEHLPQDSHTLLGQASVAGIRFDVQTLLRLSGEELPTLLEALQRAAETLFIQPDAGLSGWYDFASEQTRNVFYQSLAPDQRQSLHRTLGTMQEEHALATGEVTETAWHYEQAGDLDRALQFMERLSQDFIPRRGAEVAVRPAKDWQVASELTPSQIQGATHACAMMSRWMRSVGQYGASSPVAQTSFETTLALLITLLTDVGAIEVMLTEDDFAINGQHVPPTAAPAELKLVLAKHRLSGFQMVPGVDREQFSAFVHLLLGSRESIVEGGGWSRISAGRGIRSFLVNETVFIGVAEKELLGTSRFKHADEHAVAEPSPVVEPPPPPPREDIDMAALEALMSEFSQAVLSAQTVEGHMEAIRELVRKRNSSAILTHGGFLTGEVSADEATLSVIRELLRRARADELVRLLALASSVDQPLKTFMESRPELLIAGLDSGDEAQRTLAALALVNLGAGATPWLIRHLRSTDSATGRAAAAFLLMKIEPDVLGLLIGEILSSSSVEESTRLLYAMQLARLPWRESMFILVHSSSGSVRRAAGQVLLDSPIADADKVDLLMSAARSDNLTVSVDAVRLLGDLGSTQAVLPLGAVLEAGWMKKSAAMTGLYEQICVAFGRIRSALGLPFLRNVLRTGFSTQLVGQWDASVRAAAVWAVGMIPGTEAQELLEKQLTAGDAGVKGAARMALENRQRAQGAGDTRQHLVSGLQSEGLTSLQSEQKS